MRVICIYREDEDYTRSVTDFLENFYRQTGQHIEEMNPDENSSFCETYDIVEYPTIVALDNNGGVREMWHGRDLPRINDVSYYIL